MNNQYSDESFLSKVKVVFEKGGRKIAYSVLLLRAILLRKETSLADKAVIVATMVYFIFPLDAIPDLIPGLGYTDDLSAIMATLYRLHSNITPQVKAQANRDFERIFGEPYNAEI
ncbi:YkvA family protein [Spirosoma migulaei]